MNPYFDPSSIVGAAPPRASLAGWICALGVLHAVVGAVSLTIYFL